MIQTIPFSKHASEYDAWYEKYPDVYASEVEAVKQQLLKLSKDIHGIEVGLGTGRFSIPLGLKEGIEPVREMAEIATRRGVEVMQGKAENLPYRDLHFDFVLFVTICHLDNVHLAFKEAHRVLKKGGAIIIGFLDKDRPVARSYDEKRDVSNFYKNARFYTVERVSKLLEDAGFVNPEFNQTLFGKLEDIQELQHPVDGYGEGSFVVVKAVKK